MKKTKKWVAVAASAILSGCLFGGAIAVTVRPVAEEAKLDTTVGFEAEYEVGSSVVIPDARLVYDGKSLSTEKKVICPNGAIVDEDVVEVAYQGDYTVEYSAVTESGETLKKTYAFDGYYSLYGVSRKNSSAYYGASTKYGGIEGRDGLVVSLASGDTFEWKEVIDLREKTSSDHLVELYVTPNTLGTADAKNLCIVLTDIYDPTNYVTVTAKKVTAVNVGAAWAEQNTYVTAGASGQLQMGLLKDDTNKNSVVYEGEVYGRAIGDKMGTGISNFSLPGVPNYKQNDASSISEENFLNNPQLFTVSFDSTRNAIFAGNGTSDVIIADLDAEECFDSLWGGFTTGEVYLSVKGTDYLSSSLNFVVTTIDGKNVGEKAANGNKIVDRTAPVLTVDASDDIPNAVVGVPYAVFNATAIDTYDGAIAPIVSVTYGGKAVGVTDGKFVPSGEGKYLVTYTAVDYSGNVASQSISVTAKQGKTLSFKLDAANTDTQLTGTKISVSGYTVDHVSGELNVAITATRITDGKNNVLTDGVVYNAQDGTFCPMYAGKYRVDYVASDYLKEVKRSYTITVENNPAVVIVDEPTLPRYYINGMVYATPNLVGYYFEDDGPHAVETVMDWSGDGGKTYTKADTIFAPTASDTLLLRWTASYRDRTAAVKTVEAAVVDVGYNGVALEIENYFVVADGNASVSAKSDRLCVNVQDEASLVFANALQTANFSLRCDIGAMRGYSVSLTAANDESKCLQVYYSDTGTGKMAVTVVTPNGTYSNSFNYTSGSQITLKYVDASKTLFLTDKITVDLSKYFDGFNDKVWLELRFEESGDACLYELNGQVLTDITTDRIRPMISVDVEAGDRMLGDTYKIEKCTIGDVLDAYVVAYMYMTTPTGAFATAKDGTVLDCNADYGKEYEVSLDSYGIYTVYYYAKDSAGNAQTFTFQITVADSVPPEIKTEEHNRFVKLGEEIKPADYTVTDDLSSKEEIKSYVCIVRPDGSGVGGKQSITATMKGVYKIVYYAFDAYGNMSVLTYEITVL